MTEGRRWLWLAALTALPLTAILHHVVFFRPTCILNPFKAPDYTLRYIGVWLAEDPSLLLAGVAAVALYLVGRRWHLARVAATALLVAFLPVTVWLWDIPGTGRWICHNFHDGRIGLHTRHLYLFGLALWTVLIIASRVDPVRHR